MPSLRAASWAPKRDGTPATLRKSSNLWKSIRTTEVTNEHVTVSSNVIYAAIHQLGGRTGRGGKATMPARPYFPILNGKLTPLAQERILKVGQAKADILLR